MVLADCEDRCEACVSRLPELAPNPGNSWERRDPRFILPMDSSPLYMLLQHDVAVPSGGFPHRAIDFVVFFCSSRALVQ